MINIDQRWVLMCFVVFFRQKLSAEEPTIALPNPKVIHTGPIQRSHFMIGTWTWQQKKSVGFVICIPWRIHMYAIYGNMDPINIPQMLAYIYHTWILWVWLFKGVVRGAIFQPLLKVASMVLEFVEDLHSPNYV